MAFSLSRSKLLLWIELIRKSLKILKLPNELSIVQVDVLHQDLLSELNNSRDICLDISDVMSADTASVQLLCALQKHLLTINQKIAWVGSSDALKNVIEQLGLSEYLASESTN